MSLIQPSHRMLHVNFVEQMDQISILASDFRSGVPQIQVRSFLE
jgi:hypothetical protein